MESLEMDLQQYIVGQVIEAADLGQQVRGLKF